MYFVKWFLCFLLCFFNMWFDIIGESVNVVIFEMNIVFVRVKVNFLKSEFVIFFINVIGEYIVLRVMVIEIIGIVILCVLIIVVLNDDLFFFMWCFMFLSMMIVLFIIKLIVRINVNKVNRLIEKLNICRKNNILISEIGIVIIGIIIVCNDFKNRIIIINMIIVVLIIVL